VSKERDWQDIKAYWQFLSDRSDDFVYQIFYPNGAGQQQHGAAWVSARVAD